VDEDVGPGRDHQGVGGGESLPRQRHGTQNRICRPRGV